MKTYQKYLAIIAIMAVSISVGYNSFPANEALANPGVFNIKPPLTVGTTTPLAFGGNYTYLKAGFSTTTSPILDSYASGTFGSLDSASMLLQFTATATPATLKWRFEYSQDSLDWYSEDMELTTNATTTIHVRDFAEHSWLFASSTTNGLTSNSRIHKIVPVKTPVRYVRAVFYLPPGSPDAALFQQWVSRSQK